MDSSSTYQDSIFTFDGHGRGLTRHLPVEDTNASTSWTYNADDTVATVTDPRGAVTTYKYGNVDDGTSSEYRTLLTKISYSVPQSSTIPVPGNVNFVYDAAANRTSMTDDSGSLVYSYDELSRLKTETKDFADTLANAPNGVYVLSYNYHLTGGIKSIEDPFGSEVTYSTDNTGRTTAIGGSGFGSLTSFASNMSYRAFGGMKAMTYSTTTPTNITVAWNNRLRPSTFEAESAANTNDVHNKTYTYNNDGTLKQAVNSVEGEYSRYNDYDFAGRVKRNEFGTSAVGENKPYKQLLGYDAFDNITNRQTWVRSSTVNGFTAGYTNGRKTSGGYGLGTDVHDAAGNVVTNIIGSTNVRTWKFDAAGRTKEWLETTPYVNTVWDQGATLTFDGDGRTAKRFIRDRNRSNGNESWAEDTEYYIISSVTGQTITELSETGAKAKTTVYFGDTVVAEQSTGSPMVFKTTDPISGSVMQSEVSGAITPYDVGRVEVESLGGVVPTQPEETQSPVSRYLKGGYVGNPETGCTWNRSPIPCNLLGAALRYAGGGTLEVNARVEGGWQLAQRLQNSTRTWRYDVWRRGDLGNGDPNSTVIPSSMTYEGYFYVSYPSPFLDTLVAQTQPRFITYDGRSYEVVADTYKDVLKQSMSARTRIKKCKDALDALLKSLGSEFRTIDELYASVSSGSGFLQTVLGLHDDVEAFAKLEKKQRVIVANGNNRNYSTENYLPNVYGAETTTLIHELLHLALDGKTISHTKIAKSMFSASTILGDKPISATRNDGTDFSNPRKNSDAENRDYMNRWINTYCPAATPPK